jgi:hypothetical protein
MKKVCVLLGTLFACGLAGCGSDANDEVVSKVIDTLKDTTRSIDAITRIVKTEVDIAKAKNTPLDEKKILEAKAEAEKLKEQATLLQRLKARTDFMKDSLSADQKADLAKKHKDGMAQAANELYNAQKSLETAMLEADEVNKMPSATATSKAVLQDLRKALENSQKEFAVMSKRQS